MIKLSERLQKIADLIQTGETVADIGTDHGFLPAYLWECGKSPKVVLTDISQSSLQKAVDNVLNMEIPEEILNRSFKFIQGDGIEKIGYGEVDALTIAGMGGILMTEILGADIKKTGSFKKIILQPRNSLGKLRWWLEKNNFKISEEHLVKEGKNICEILLIENDPNKPSTKKVVELPLSYMDNTIYDETDLGNYEFPEENILRYPSLGKEFLNYKIAKEIQILKNLELAAKKDENKIKITKERLEYFRYLESLSAADVHKS